MHSFRVSRAGPPPSRGPSDVVRL
uniref:Uncharacterized protein n=1 Tax=Anguilla anguilla TaxID=7936 RepID=A0A0E9PE54_ANGAN